jgi:hypothetical protein
MRDSNPEAKDFSEIENCYPGIKVIQELVAKAGKEAASEATAAGIPRVFARDNRVIQQYSDGKVEIISIARGRMGILCTQD